MTNQELTDRELLGYAVEKMSQAVAQFARLVAKIDEHEVILRNLVAELDKREATLRELESRTDALSG